MNPANIVGDLVKDIKERLNLDGKNRVFEEGRELNSDFMKERAEPEAFTKEFLIDKILDPLELEKLPEKSFETPKGHRSVDYRIKGKTGMFLVEAKPLNANLFEKSRYGGVNQIKGLFRLAEVKEDYDFGVATDGLRWVFIDKNKEVVSDLNLEANYEQIHEFLVGEEKVISPKTEEEISKKFYGWYNALLHGGRYKDHENKQKTVSEDDCLVNNIIGVKEMTEKEQIAQVVMNRLIFIKFLQSKGIIKEDILKYLSEIEEDLLTSKLKQLFFSVLNTPEDKRSDIDERFNDIPYLNGSLFIHTEVEFMRRNFDYKVRAEILKNVLQFLDSFKFVHKEQLGNGDSLDPEILGYIFERAMTATDRKGTGAYYTPKSITKYISENTIYPCIIEKTNEILETEKGYKDTELIKEIEELFILPATTLKEIWEKIILKLRVLDNACGSGAFLLAAANILFALNKKINDKIGAENPDTTLKILILVNNLYGVDINPNGIEIAKLRLWLWLADSYEPGYIKPLPNIDYNLRVGNSLIGYVDLGEFRGAKLTLSDFLQDEEKPTLDRLLKERNELIHEYKISWGEEAKELKESVRELDVKISNLLNADLYREFREKKIEINRDEFLKLNPFHWGFEFYEAFELDKTKEERGFDVVIGNPPYVRPHKINKINKEILWKYLTTFKAKSDLYSCFMEKGIILLNEGGLLSYIVPHTWTSLESFFEIRKYILNNCKVLKLVHLPKKVFLDATVETTIFIMSKGLNSRVRDGNEIVVESLTDRGEITFFKKFKQFQIKSNYLYNFGLYIDKFDTNLLNKIKDRGERLGNFIEFHYGLKTGDDQKFVFDEPKFRECRKLLRSKDIGRYSKDFKREYVWYVPDRMIKNKKTARPGSKERFETEKIIVARMGKQVVATYDNEGYYVKDAMLLLKKSEKINLIFITGILNSKLLNYYYKNYFITIDVLKNALLELPIIFAHSDPDDRFPHGRIVPLVEQMLELHEQLAKTTTETDKAMLQRQIDATDQEIDNLVYELYELTPEEIAIVEESSK
jgi:type I restriction-modification system DNA methylase subunit